MQVISICSLLFTFQCNLDSLANSYAALRNVRNDIRITSSIVCTSAVAVAISNWRLLTHQLWLIVRCICTDTAINQRSRSAGVIRRFWSSVEFQYPPETRWAALCGQETKWLRYYVSILISDFTRMSIDSRKLDGLPNQTIRRSAFSGRTHTWPHSLFIRC